MFGSTTDSDFPIHYDRTQELPPPVGGKRPTAMAEAAAAPKPSHPPPPPTTTTSASTHPSSIFCLPTAESPKDKLFFLEDARPGRRIVQTIGYTRPAHMSDNMSYSLQWSKPGELVPLDTIKPYPNYYPRSMFAAAPSSTSAAAVAEAARQRAAQSREDYLASFSSVQPPLHHPFPTAPPNTFSPFYPVPPPTSTPLSRLNQEREDERDKAREWLKQYAQYDPYPGVDPNERLPPSHYDAAYHDTSKGGAQKVSLITHDRANYVLDRRRNVIRSTEGPNVGHASYHGRDHRWTEEMLHYRCQQQADEEKSRQLLAQRNAERMAAAAAGTGGSPTAAKAAKATTHSIAATALQRPRVTTGDPMDEPMYSSFTAAAKRVEAKRPRRRAGHGVRMEPPRYARATSANASGGATAAAGEAEAGAGAAMATAETLPERAQTSPPAHEAYERRSSGVVVEDVTEEQQR